MVTVKWCGGDSIFNVLEISDTKEEQVLILSRREANELAEELSEVLRTQKQREQRR